MPGRIASANVFSWRPHDLHAHRKQAAANKLLASDARHVLLVGGSRSGKTFVLCRAIAARAMKAAGSRHLIVRYRFNHAKASIWHDTWPR